MLHDKDNYFLFTLYSPKERSTLFCRIIRVLLTCAQIIANH
ncbi:hypothetical protein HMPREF2141_03989 [Bacteroides uniformis]|uniref:Uncharacterized protein n=1 Tax=Bacteroides uniformis (strain ATCC 8492 / DSM 6597 / CCUG 4942 / CIP 103695 / JCM 5828 / KCTC 5204 / NCTC 13054 / VPI 0061) TaxID=411479 RepID=A0ABC9NGL5_BACUC|nr:hypothetical protein BACUNI_00501 [Bacteroides uniformis ATCC 8492]KXT30791.1 hypothetical protein HMPREF2141_03989 [Bacteroides uniformis]